MGRPVTPLLNWDMVNVKKSAADKRGGGRLNMVRVICSALAFALMGAAIPAQALEVKMVCEKKDGKYLVTFDTNSNVFSTTNISLGGPLKVHKVQNDEDGVLVWGSTTVFGGERDILALFGREKWVKYFYGNGSVVTDPCK